MDRRMIFAPANSGMTPWAAKLVHSRPAPDLGQKNVRARSVADLERGDEGGLGNFNVADLAHAFLAGLLLFEQLALA